MNRIPKLFCAGVFAPVFLVAVSTAMNGPRSEDPAKVAAATATSTRADDLKKGGPCVCMSNDVIGTKVVSTQGEKLGKIEDLVINSNGEIAYGVLSFGGVLGIGDKYFAVPWRVLRADLPKVTGKEKSDERAFVLPIDKEKLKTAPGFDKAHWPAMVDANWSKDIDAFYGAARPSDAARTVEASAKSDGPIWKASDLKGHNVKSPSGDNLGDIKDLAIDTGGQLNYAVISVGGFLGMGDRLVAVPFGALKIARDASSDKRVITLSSTKDQLKAAPQFDDSKEKRAEMCDPVWVGRVYDYYSVRPYWPRSEG